MNQFKPAYFKLRNVLVSSVAVIGLASGAQAQVAELKGLMDNKDFGGSSSFYLPLGNVTTGMPFFNIGAGLLGGSKSGEALVGYGQGFGNIGIRGYAGVGLKDSHHNLFTTARAGFEVSVGGFGLNVSGSVPFGKTRQVAKNGHRDVVLVDPSGQQCDPTGACVPVPPSCSNPLPGQVKHCEIGVAVTDPSYEKALKGFEVGLDYQVQVGGVWLRPSLGYYRYGNGIVSGAKAGLEVSVPLTSQLSLNVGVGGQKAFKDDENNKRLSGFGSLGISYHFGQTPVSQLSALEHRFAEAPNRNQRTLTTQTKEGNTTVYRNNAGNATGQGFALVPLVAAIWEYNTADSPISQVWFIDGKTASQLDDVVQKAGDNAIVLVDGSEGTVATDDTVKFNDAHVGIVGGGSTLFVKATIDGGKTYFNTQINLPGTRPTIYQGNASKDVFFADGVTNPVLYALDISGGKRGASFLNSKEVYIEGVKVRNTVGEGVYAEGVDSIDLGTTAFYNTGGTSGSFRNSSNITLDHVYSYDNKSSGGFSFVNSQFIDLSQVLAVADYDSHNFSTGIWVSKSQDVNFTNVSVGNFQQYGIGVFETNNVTGNNLNVVGEGDGILIGGGVSNKTVLNNVRIQVNSSDFHPQNSALSIGSTSDLQVSNLKITNSRVESAIEIGNSKNVKISDVTITDSKDTDGALFIFSSNTIQVENVNVSGGEHDAIVSIEDSGSVHVKNVAFENGYDEFGIIVVGDFPLFPGDNKDITFENISIDGARTGVRLSNTYIDNLEVSLKDVVIKNAKLVAFELFDGILIHDLGGNKSIASAAVCDGTINKNNGVTVDVGGAFVVCK